jgi:hypothetical protein
MDNLTAIIFTGTQASGKTSFYMQNFVKTHIRDLAGEKIPDLIITLFDLFPKIP